MSRLFVRAHQRDDGSVHFAIWLDTSKATGQANVYTFTDAGGNTINPDPDHVRVHVFGPSPEGWTSATLNGTTYTDWPAYCAAEAELLAEAEAQATQPPTYTVLPMQGQTF